MGRGQDSRYAGHFIYADTETLWECKGTTVSTTDLSDLQEARGVQNYNEGSYQNTAITINLAKHRHKLTVNGEERGRQLIVFLNMVVWMRTGGDEGSSELKKLPPAIMGAVAAEVARTGEFPTRFDSESLDVDVTDVLIPKLQGSASFGMVNYLIILAVAAASVLIFRELNVGWRDDQIWDNIKDIRPSREMVKPVLLRMYLRDPRNTNHRAEAKTMLVDLYKANIAANCARRRHAYDAGHA